MKLIFFFYFLSLAAVPMVNPVNWKEVLDRVSQEELDSQLQSDEAILAAQKAKTLNSIPSENPPSVGRSIATAGTEQVVSAGQLRIRNGNIIPGESFFFRFQNLLKKVYESIFAHFKN